MSRSPPSATSRNLRRNPRVAPLQAALESDRPLLAGKSWKILAGIPGDAADALFVKHLDFLRAADGVSPHAIELIAASRKRATPVVTAALAALETSLTENKDPLAKWNIALQGGDPKAGQALFTSHPAGECMRCHRAGQDHGTGGETAPNLAGIGNRQKDRRYFLESMLSPSAALAPGFAAVSIDFKNGAALSGNLISSTPDHLDLLTNNKAVRVRRSDIASVTDPVSPMPPMGELLTPAELRDLIAWLASLTQDDEPIAASAAATPELLDPATLPVPETSASPAIDPAVLKIGKTQFIVCAACHGQNGEGTAAGPPLAGSEWVNGPAENLIRIQLRGLQGPITVKGQTYHFPAGMAPLAYQTDEQIAAVLSYVRSSFGNSAPPVTPAQVAALRGEAGKPPLSAADLIPPLAVSETPPPAAPSSSKYDDLRPSSYSPVKIILIALLAIGLGAFAVRLLAKRQS